MRKRMMSAVLSVAMIGSLFCSAVGAAVFTSADADSLPKAAVIDIDFSDGTPTDKAQEKDVFTIGSPQVYFSEELGKYVGSFDFDSAYGYMFSLEDYEAVAQSLAVECYFKYRSFSSSSEQDVFSAQQLGGFGLGRYNGKFTRFVRVASGDGDAGTSIEPASDLPVNAEEWYHMLLTFDGSAARLYVNGALQDTVSASGTVKIPDAEGGRGILIGGDISDTSGLQFSADCEVSIARVYDMVPSDEQVKALYEDASRGPVYEDGLVMYSSFDDIQDGKVLDATGRGNDGTIVGNPQTVEGIQGDAVRFENTASKGETADQYINYGQPDDLQFGTGDYSISFWYKADEDARHDGAIMGNKNYASGGNNGWAIGQFNETKYGGPDVRLNFRTSASSRSDVEGMKVQDGRWHHIVATFDRDGDMSAYYDGELFDKTSITAHTGASIDLDDFVVGADGNKTYALSGGEVDELRVYNKVIDEEVITALYQKDAPGATDEQKQELLDL